MAACSKGYTLSRDHVNLVLTIVQQARFACTAGCSADCALLTLVPSPMPSAHASSSVTLMKIAAVPARDSSLPDSGDADSAADDDAAPGVQQASDERLAAIDAALQPDEAAR